MTAPQKLFFYVLKVERWLPEIRKNAAFLYTGNAVCLFILCAVPLRRSEKTERNVARQGRARTKGFFFLRWGISLFLCAVRTRRSAETQKGYCWWVME